MDPSGHCGETYSGNADLNAQTNRQCYDLAEKFTNELADSGRVPLLDDGTTASLSDYNLNVLQALYTAWHEGSFGLSQPVLPSSEKLPLGQGFEVNSMFVKYPDENLVKLNVLSGGSNVVGLVGGVGGALAYPPAGAGIFLVGEIVSGIADLATIGYIGWNSGVSKGIDATADWAKGTSADIVFQKKLQMQLIVAEEKMMGKDITKMLLREAASFGAPSVLGAMIDLGSIVEEGHKGTVIQVTPKP